MDVAIASSLSRLGYTEIRPHQRKTVEGYLKAEDVFLCAKTGSGKSLTFEIAPFVFEYMNSKQIRDKVDAIVLVVSPLVALMRSQVKDLCRRGINAGYLSDTFHPDADTRDTSTNKFSLDDIKSGLVNIVFGSPESFVYQHRDMLKGFGDRVKAIFVDEAHCVVKL
jgi:ATP-dependent DNA helicase RecQ